MTMSATEATTTGAPVHAATLRAGDRVRVKSREAILATLDAEGRVDGLPFMPEMLSLAGLTFPVDAVVHRTCNTVTAGGGTTRGMERTVHLAGVRCDGSAHGGCQARCLLYWKDEWLEAAPASAPGEVDVDVRSSGSGSAVGPLDDVPAVLERATHGQGHTPDEPVYACQATEVERASRHVSTRLLRLWVRDVRSRNVGLRTALVGAAVLTFNKVVSLTRKLPSPLRIRGGKSWPSLQPTGEKVTPPSLDLRLGELVEIKPLAEIEATLGKNGYVRGLRFTPEMVPHCGRRARVVGRVERIVDERSGKMLRLRDCIMLEDVWCEGTYRALCRRKIPIYWREAWLRRVDKAERSG